ncbi:baseplate wedge component [Synechococcus phage S-RIM2]|uniref:Baseplate wedge component n=1 Tax=Synechococcus phage S-RIM2 TaxID=687800 RepID=A0A1D7RY28_9CAUD|nr:baseplate wedge component [Synechococcus phage S-RIM2]AOO04589.1 baseplate wedge component [Synechococcus phage S-RIM2]AOO06299.1 baseplate wedge component [Synechococcus phage S-RIM2]
MAAYFSYFPNVYIGEGVTSDEAFKYRLTKNIFRRMKARDDLEKYSTTFEAYSVKTDETPSGLAHRIYKDAHLDWIILLVNNITDVYEGWPKSEASLQTFVRDKYEDPDAVHHYETNEVLFEDIVYIKKNIDVNESFRAVMPDGSVKTADESRFPVTNYEHEYYLNEKKRLIRLPNSYLIDLMSSEMREQLAYQPNVEIDKQGNKKTPLSASSRFINNDAAVIASGSNITALGAVTSFDNGPTSSGVAGTSAAVVATAATTTTTVTNTSSSSSSSSSSSGSSSGSGGY